MTDAERIMFYVADLFFAGKKAPEIAETVNKELRPTVSLTRESVYQWLIKARQNRYLRLMPPMEDTLAQDVASMYGLKPDQVRVVYTPTQNDSYLISEAAADWVLELLADVVAEQPVPGAPVGLGLGPGRATLDFAKHLSLLLSRREQPLDQQAQSPRPVPQQLNLVAISSGCPAYHPEYASVSFFNLFPKDRISKRVGLFAETMVPANQFRDIQSRSGVREAFAERDEISIVVNSMGDMIDEHDLLRTYMVESGRTPDELMSDGWVGNVQYRPFTSDGPVREENNELRAVTLFELDDYVRMSRTKDRYVVLIGRRCGVCGMSRARALRPLLSNPALRVFSHLIMDVTTAEDLINIQHNGGANVGGDARLGRKATKRR